MIRINVVVIENVKDFNLRHTFLCGQCFRWNEESDGSFTGVAGGRVVNISFDGGKMTITGATENDYNKFWKNYLDMERDYSAIKSRIARGEIMKRAIEYGWGIRILRQDFWECLISFIISQNNNINRIRLVIEKICECCGEKLEFCGKTYYTFPSPEALSSLSEADFSELGAGYRAKYLVRAVRDVLSGRIDGERLKKTSLAQAKKELLSVYGVGEKVADCILLFSLGKFGVFPADVWIERVMRENFACGKNAAQLGMEIFGEFAGFAQQYLYYWRRNYGH